MNKKTRHYDKSQVSIGLGFLEIDYSGGLFEFFVRGEAHLGSFDMLTTDYRWRILTFSIRSQPEGAKLAQLHDVSISKFRGDQTQKTFDHCHRIAAAHGRDLGNRLR